MEAARGAPLQPGTQPLPDLQAWVFYSGWDSRVVGSVKAGMGVGQSKPLANSYCDGYSSAVAIVTGALRRK